MKLHRWSELAYQELELDFSKQGMAGKNGPCATLPDSPQLVKGRLHGIPSSTDELSDGGPRHSVLFFFGHWSSGLPRFMLALQHCLP